jgi:membrane-associated phospholipid phosphatase
MLWASSAGRAEAQTYYPDYLSTGEALGIGATSLAVFVGGNRVKHANSETAPRWIVPPGFDEKIVRFFGREVGPGRENFLDSDLGSGITTVGVGMILLGADLGYARGDEARFTRQDQFLFYSGALATKGVTDFFKGLVARQRPLSYLVPEVAARRVDPNLADDHYSFFSGHTSSAFYAMTYLNLRLRSLMRQEMSPDEYRGRRWLSPALCFGWATFVGISRLQAYRHYPTDVLAGALVGYLLGELFYGLGDGGGGGQSSAPLMLRFSFTF